jgi:exonuclease SbcD
MAEATALIDAAPLRLASLRIERAETAALPDAAPPSLADTTPEALFLQAFRAANGTDPDARHLAAFRDALAEV